MASWLMHLTRESTVWVQVLAGDIVLCSWASHFTLTLPLSTLVDKWVLANVMLEATLRLTSIPSSEGGRGRGGGGSRNTPGCFMLQKSG